MPIMPPTVSAVILFRYFEMYALTVEEAKVAWMEVYESDKMAFIGSS